MKIVNFKKLDPRAKIPSRAYNSAGYDLFPLETGKILPLRSESISLGF